VLPSAFQCLSSLLSLHSPPHASDVERCNINSSTVGQIGKKFAEGSVVADEDYHRLQVIRLSDGACLRTIGSEGSGAGQFNSPQGVAFDSAGHIIVADTWNLRVQVLRYSDGSLRTISSYCSGPGCSGPGQFKYPDGIVIDGQKHIIVSKCRQSTITACSCCSEQPPSPALRAE
jgi:hypothetical protein